MKKSKVIVVRYQDGRVYRRFGSMLSLGRWLFSRRGTYGRVWGWSKADLALFRRLRLSPTLLIRAAKAYLALLMGTSRTWSH